MARLVSRAGSRGAGPSPPEVQRKVLKGRRKFKKPSGESNNYTLHCTPDGQVGEPGGVQGRGAVPAEGAAEGVEGQAEVQETLRGIKQLHPTLHT